MLASGMNNMCTDTFGENKQSELSDIPLTGFMEESLEEAHSSTVQEPPKHGRKRTRNEADWKRNIRKRARAQGCTSSCRQKCHDRISAEQRNAIFHQYYGLSDYRKQSEYLSKTVIRVHKKQLTTNETSRRKWSLQWSLIIDNKNINDCRKFYLDTLAIKEGIGYNVVGKLSPEGMLDADRRGNYLIEPGLTIAQMYRMYLEWCQSKIITPVNGATNIYLTTSLIWYSKSK